MEQQNNEKIVISLGGSLIVPGEVDINFLKNFRKLILSQIEKGKKFVIITGGGKLARKYNDLAKEITDIRTEDLDGIGIGSTRLNARLVRAIFGDLALKEIVLNPDIIPETDKPVILGGLIVENWRLKDYESRGGCQQLRH